MTYSAKQSSMSTRSTLKLPNRAAYRKFVNEILKEVQLEDLYSHEINFKGKVGDTDYI